MIIPKQDIHICYLFHIYLSITLKCIKAKIFLFNQKLVLPSKVKNTSKITIFRMCYGEKGTVKLLETLADNVFRHNYSMMQIYKKKKNGENFGVTQVYIHP